jgi:hypothetical protein
MCFCQGHSSQSLFPSTTKDHRFRHFPGIPQEPLTRPTLISAYCLTRHNFPFPLPTFSGFQREYFVGLFPISNILSFHLHMSDPGPLEENDEVFKACPEPSRRKAPPARPPQGLQRHAWQHDRCSVRSVSGAFSTAFFYSTTLLE